MGSTIRGGGQTLLGQDSEHYFDSGTGDAHDLDGCTIVQCRADHRRWGDNSDTVFPADPRDLFGSSGTLMHVYGGFGVPTAIRMHIPLEALVMLEFTGAAGSTILRDSANGTVRV